MNDDRFRQYMKEFREEAMRHQAAARAEAIERAAKEARAELRDRLAMAALTGLLANANENHGHRRSSEGYAMTAYDIADAMLKARGND